MWSWRLLAAVAIAAAAPTGAHGGLIPPEYLSSAPMPPAHVARCMVERLALDLAFGPIRGVATGAQLAVFGHMPVEY